jgi:HlyD family secretion protein
MENEVETTNLQIEELEKEKKAASQDGQTSLNMQILSLQSDVAKAEYDIKAKKAENKKIKKSIGNAEVVSTVDGTVKTVQDADSLAYSDSNVLVSISKGGNYRVKGTVNEQLIGNIYQGMPVIIRSRVDDTATWSGVISEIDTNPQSSSDEDYYSDGDDSSSSKYSFYVEPDSLDGLMLGQHIIIEPDTGETEDGEKIEKKGIWLYSDYVFEENGKSYVWVRNSKEKMEKREVEIGQRDDSTGDCEIASGLEKDDYIAYPSADIVEGMTGTTDADDPDIAEQDYGDDYAGDTYGEDYADYGEDGNYEDGDAEYYGEDGVYDDGDVEYDGEDGYYGDEDGEFEDTGIGED